MNRHAFMGKFTGIKKLFRDHARALKPGGQWKINDDGIAKNLTIDDRSGMYFGDITLKEISSHSFVVMIAGKPDVLWRAKITQIGLLDTHVITQTDLLTYYDPVVTDE